MKPELNPSQRAAVKYIDGPLLVLAGAGSGKTRVITEKIAYLIRHCEIPAGRIAAVTFTNKSAREMKSRVKGLLSAKQSRGLKVSTFHTLGLSILRRECKLLGYKPGFSIYDVQDCSALLKELLRKSDTGDTSAEKIQWQISQWKNNLVEPQQAQRDADGEPDLSRASLIYEAYDRCLKSYNAVDFDDLIRLPATLFASNAESLDQWQNRVRYLLIDEYQDTNASQYRLVQQLVGVRGALTVVGDDDQSIYGWRGAQPENLAQLQQDYSNLKVIKLEQNYRSTGCILQAANHLISNNPHVFEKRLWSAMGFGELLKVIQVRDEHHEAERVTTLILHDKFQSNGEFSDYAILYRGNYQSRLFERCLREYQIPYRLTGGLSFFAYAEVKDIMAYWRLIANPDDNHAFLRIVNTPRREIGPATLEKLADYAAQRQISLCEASDEMGLEQILPARAVNSLRHFVEWLAMMGDRATRGDLKSLVNDLVDEIGYQAWLETSCNDSASAERRMENVMELTDWMARLIDSKGADVTLGDLVSHLQLMDRLDRDEQDNQDNCVQLMTLHAAKGLEFPHVYIVGMEEETLPHHSSIDMGDIDEERRLAYVGITRAQKTLTFSCASRRKRAGKTVDCEPSRFLSELPDDTLVWEGKKTTVDPVQRLQQGRAHLNKLRDILGDTT